MYIAIKRMANSLVVLLLLGCSAAGVPYMSDPMDKLASAYELMGTQGRGIAAEKIGLEVLKTLKGSDKAYEIAEAHTFLGLYYKSAVYHEHKDFYIRQGEYEPTASKSISHFKLAARAFEQYGDYWGVSKVYFALGNAYLTDRDNCTGCRYFERALSIYRSDKNVFKGRVHTYNSAYPSYDAMIEAFIKARCTKES